MKNISLHQSWDVGIEDWIPLSLLQLLRETEFRGEEDGLPAGGPDELLLLAGGPPSSAACSSLLAGPLRIRFRAIQPGLDALPAAPPHTPLGGAIQLTSAAPPLIWSKEEWNGTAWIPQGSIEGAGLADSLRAIEQHLSGDQESDQDADCVKLAGLLTYDLVQWTTPLRLQHPPQPGSTVGLLWCVDRYFLHDRIRGTLHLFAQANDAWAKSASALMCDQLQEPQPTPLNGRARSASTETDGTHRLVVEQIQEAITAGQLYQLNFGRRWEGSLLEEPWQVMLRLCANNPAPYSGWMDVPDLALSIASSSPELLLSKHGLKVSTQPIKGTRPRGVDADEDEEYRAELVSSRKEVAEHLMLVDLQRNDLSQVCRVGSVEWSDWRIESYPEVQHMVSEVSGHLEADMDGWDALGALFPGGSITGCPKVATIAAIDQLEQQNRSAWTGSLGWSDVGGSDAAWNILIRTMQVIHTGPKQTTTARSDQHPSQKESGVSVSERLKTRTDQTGNVVGSTDRLNYPAVEQDSDWYAVIQAGGGIVIDSDAAAEVQESRWKAAALGRSAWGWNAESDDDPARRLESGLLIHPVPPKDGEPYPHIRRESTATIFQTIPEESPTQKSRSHESTKNADCSESVDSISVADDIPPMESISAAESSTNSESTHTRPRVWSRGDEPLRPPDGKRLLFLDCLDSFSWNIVHAVAGTGCEVLVHHSRDRRACMAEELLQMTQPTHLLLGPGPGRPDNSPLGVRLAEMALAGALLTAAGVPQPLLGICLGHQAIGLAAGWDLVQSPLGAVHGVPEQIKHDQQGLFTKLPTPLPMMRYHSLVLQPSSDDLKVVASDAATESLVMALRHPSLPVYGVQFHPESCGSRDGIQILHNFLEI